MNTPPIRPHYLWLLPEAASSARFDLIIKALAMRAATAAFDPHVTLLGSMRGEPSELLERTRTLAQRLAPFEIAVEHTDHGPHYFRCVYWAARLDAILASARTEAECEFRPARDEAPYAPHLSLVYGALDAATRHRLAVQADELRPTTFPVDRLRLVAGAPDYCDWQTLATCALRGSRATAAGSPPKPGMTPCTG